MNGDQPGIETNPLPEPENCRIADCIDQIMADDISKPLQSPMTFSCQPNYPVDLKLLADRLRNGFYRTKEAILFDARAFLSTVM